MKMDTIFLMIFGCIVTLGFTGIAFAEHAPDHAPMVPYVTDDVINLDPADYMGEPEPPTSFVSYSNPPPLKQLKAGVAIQDIQCNEGKFLIHKRITLSPACVGDKAFNDLIFPPYGWAKLRIEMPTETITQQKMCFWYPNVRLVQQNCSDFTTETYNPEKYREVFTETGPLVYRIITDDGDVEIGTAVLKDVNCIRYANWLTEFQKEKIHFPEDFSRYPPWGNQIFPLVDYCNDTGHFVKNTVDGIKWDFIPISSQDAPSTEPPHPSKCKSGPPPSDEHNFDENTCDWYLIPEPIVSNVFPYIWNSYLHRNYVDFSPQERSYANTDVGFDTENENKVCSPLITKDGTDFYISSTFNVEPFEITETSITQMMPNNCQKIWKTDTVLVEPDNMLRLWLEEYWREN